MSRMEIELGNLQQARKVVGFLVDVKITQSTVIGLGDRVRIIGLGL